MQQMADPVKQTNVSCSNKYFNRAPTHFTHYQFTFTARVSWLEIWVNDIPSAAGKYYHQRSHVCAWLISISHWILDTCVGVLSVRGLKCNPKPWGALRGVTGEPYQSRELPWKDTACVQTQPSAPGKINNTFSTTNTQRKQLIALATLLLA